MLPKRVIPLKGRRISSLVKESEKLVEKNGIGKFRRIDAIDKELIRKRDKMRQKSKLSKREKRNFRLIQKHIRKMKEN